MHIHAVCLIAGIVLMAIQLWQAGAFVLAVSLVALIPGGVY